MKFLRWRLGGRDERPEADEATTAQPDEPDADERERDLELLRGERDGFDELTQRQHRYARFAWKPPSQGSDRRADDEAGPESPR